MVDEYSENEIELKCPICGELFYVYTNHSIKHCTMTCPHCGEDVIAINERELYSLGEYLADSYGEYGLDISPKDVAGSYIEVR